MKTKILIALIVISSFISGTIGSYIFLYFVNPELNNIITSTVQKDIIKDGKTINITDVQSEITKLVKESGPGVVNIVIKKDIDLYRRDPWGFFQEKVGSVEKEVGGGSGFFVTKDGIIMTNKHVVSDTSAKYTVITNEGKEYDASVLALDPLTDLAIIKIDSAQKNEFKVLNAIEDENFINIGEFAVAIGNALGEFQNSVSFGVISGKNRSIEASGENIGTEKLTGLLQTDAAINPGNSGGPLLDLNGEIMGINTAVSGNGQGLGFSIPLSKKRINYILASIKKYGSIKRPFIGINYLPINDSIAKELGLNVNYGAYIANEEGSIVKGSSAEKSGIKAGDIVLEVDGEKIDVSTPLQNLIQNKIPGDTINLKVLKSDGEEKDIEIVLGEY